MKLHNIIAAILLVLFLAAPIGSLAVIGVPEPYGQRPFTEFKLKPSLLGHDGGLRSEFVRAILERSPLRKAAIAGSNTFQYDVVGYIDTPQIISGRDGWLFYKAQFWDGKCLEDAEIIETFRRMSTIRAIADAASQTVLFTVSPDKATIYPEMLHPRARAYTACKAESGQRWRYLARTHAPYLIDHTPDLLAEKARRIAAGDSAPLYYSTDTHWTRAAGDIVTNRLLAELPGDSVPTVSSVVDYAGHRIPPDLGDMLLIDGRADDEPLVSYTALGLDGEDHDYVFIYDSFYARIFNHLRSTFPAASFHHFQNHVAAYERRLREKNRLAIVSIVERNLFRTEDFRLTGPLLDIIQFRNIETAKTCRYGSDSPPIQPSMLRNLTESSGRFLPMTKDPQIVLDMPTGHPVCLKFDLDLSVPGRFELYLPPFEGLPSQSRFEIGRAFTLNLSAGRHSLAFIAPAVARPSRLRIDATDQKAPFSLSGVAFGTLQGKQ